MISSRTYRIAWIVAFGALLLSGSAQASGPTHRPGSERAGAVSAGVPLTRSGGGRTSPEAAPGDSGPLVFTQNLAEARVLFIDPGTNRRVVDFVAGEALPRECLYPDGSPACFLIGGHHSVINDHDYVEFSAIRLNNSFGMIARVAVAEPHKPVWRLTRLDFTGVSSNGACKKTCGEGTPGIGCSLQWVHELVIADENPEEQWVDLVLAEMVNSRIVKVHLDYRNGNSCGQVVWVIDSSHPDWPPLYPQPNGVQLVDAPEGQFMVTTLLTEDGEAQAGGARILFWSLETGTPELLWKYPVDDGDELPYTNATHHGLVETDPITGQRYLLYGHSLGDSEEWNGGEGGAWGIATLDDLYQAPDYLGDWVLPSSFEPLAFTRELEVLSDGTFFGVDAGCYFTWEPNQSCPAHLYWFNPAGLPASDLGGQYSPDHVRQNIVPLESAEVTRKLSCGLDLLFEADVIEPAMMGRELRNAQAEGGTECPAE